MSRAFPLGQDQLGIAAKESGRGIQWELQFLVAVVLLGSQCCGCCGAIPSPGLPLANPISQGSSRCSSHTGASVLALITGLALISVITLGAEPSPAQGLVWVCTGLWSGFALVYCSGEGRASLVSSHSNILVYL